jgi:Arc/MetJ-type ribon-helix-helix transcriptional regulator
MKDGDLIRFVTHDRHPPYGHRSGVVRAALALWRANILEARQQEALRAILDWLNEHLARPERLSVSRSPRAQETALSWIRGSAQEHLSYLRRLAALVGTGGAVVDELRTKRPGYVVYEDTHQVVALPFADTPR